MDLDDKQAETFVRTELVLRQIEEHIKLIRQQESVIAASTSSPLTKIQYKDLRRRTIKTVSQLADGLYHYYIERGD